LAKLDASQLQLNLQVVRLDELLVDSVQLINTMADRKNIQIRINLDEPVEIQADKEKMKSIILNLLENAVKYSGENTIVTASLFTGPHHPGMATVSIADQGHGIPAFALPNIFKRFYRVDPSRSENPGSGLGLAIVERLVALHGGTISVESEVGKGTTFTIEFPINAYSPQKDV
jgi:two-component system phosphate regulon sensor histidine kinase PhoR